MVQKLLEPSEKPEFTLAPIKLPEKSYSETISIFQNEIIHYQILCKQQQQVITTLHEELEEKNKQVTLLAQALANQSYAVDPIAKLQSDSEYKKKLNSFASLPVIPKAKLIDDAFWQVQEEDNLESIGKELWIMNQEQKSPKIKNEPALDSGNFNYSSNSAINSQIIQPMQSIDFRIMDKKVSEVRGRRLNGTNGKSNLQIEREKYLKILQEKQPIGRDGKRIPLPAVRKTTSKVNTGHSSVFRSTEFRV